MSIRGNVWPANGAATKEEVERMYKCSYYLDRGFLKREDVVNFGIDLYKLKECGEVVMKKDIAKIRPHVKALWDRMSPSQKVMFHYSYLCEGITYVKGILKVMEGNVGDVNRESGFLDGIPDSVYLKFPPELQERIKAGFGREWVVK